MMSVGNLQLCGGVHLRPTVNSGNTVSLNVQQMGAAFELVKVWCFPAC